MKTKKDTVLAFAEIVKKWLVGTSLEGAEVEVLNYREDGEWNVAVDVIGKFCDSEAYEKLKVKMEDVGLTNVDRVEESVLPSEEGVRVYSTSGDIKLRDIVRKYNLYVRDCCAGEK